MADAALAALLAEIKLERYAEKLAAAGVGLGAVQRMADKAELRALGLPLGPAAKLFGEAQKVAAEAPAPAPREPEPEPEPEVVPRDADAGAGAELTWQQTLQLTAEVCAECENSFSSTQGRRDGDTQLWWCDWCWECFEAEQEQEREDAPGGGGGGEGWTGDTNGERVTSEAHIEVAQAPQVGVVRFKQFQWLLRALAELLAGGPVGGKGRTKRKPPPKKAEKEAAKMLSVFVFRTLAGGEAAGADAGKATRRPAGGQHTTKRVDAITAHEQRGHEASSNPSLSQATATAAAARDPLIPDARGTAAWPELRKSFTRLLASWWEVDASSEAASAGLQAWVDHCAAAADKVRATTASLRADSGRVVGRVKHWEADSEFGPVCVLECQGKRVKLSSQHKSLLWERFGRHAPSFAADDAPADLAAQFHLRLYNMLIRYETLALGDQGTQGALPPRVWTLLQKEFGVQHECFASPLNVSFTSLTFNSLFVDTDQYFGGQGSFFNAWPTSGAVEANPPFDRTTVAAMYKHINATLCSADEDAAQRAASAVPAEGPEATPADAAGDEPLDEGPASVVPDPSVVASLLEMGAGAWSRQGCARAAAAAGNQVEAAMEWCLAHPAVLAPPQPAQPADQPLLFIVVAPRSVDSKIDTSFDTRYVLGKVALQPFRHVFTRGFQHRKTALWICPNTSTVTLLGNEAARKRWFERGLSPEVARQLADAFRDDPGQRDNNRAGKA